jgi:hypothetical protein
VFHHSKLNLLIIDKKRFEFYISFTFILYGLCIRGNWLKFIIILLEILCLLSTLWLVQKRTCRQVDFTIFLSKKVINHFGTGFLYAILNRELTWIMSYLWVTWIILSFNWVIRFDRFFNWAVYIFICWRLNIIDRKLSIIDTFHWSFASFRFHLLVKWYVLNI